MVLMAKLAIYNHSPHFHRKCQCKPNVNIAFLIKSCDTLATNKKSKTTQS